MNFLQLQQNFWNLFIINFADNCYKNKNCNFNNSKTIHTPPSRVFCQSYHESTISEYHVWSCVHASLQAKSSHEKVVSFSLRWKKFTYATNETKSIDITAVQVLQERFLCYIWRVFIKDCPAVFFQSGMVQWHQKQQPNSGKKDLKRMVIVL